MDGRKRIDSWKDIAKYLGRDVRTVIRWEQHKGLPVHRVPGGGKRAAVFAYPDEIDAWLAGGGAAEANGNGTLSSRLTWSVSAGVVVAVIGLGIAAASWGWAHSGAPPTRLILNGNDLLALDKHGATRWTYRSEASEVVPPENRWSYLGDLTGDGRPEALASLEFMPPASTQHEGRLIAFTEDGDVRWSYTATDRLAFREGEFGPPWPARDLAVFGAGVNARIWWSVHHFTWWPSMLLTFDTEGRRVGTFVNSGWIRSAVPSLNGRHLFLTGVSNSHQKAFLAVLDASSPNGHSPEPPGSPMECVSCPAGNPLAYYVVPRTDVSHHQAFPGDGPTVMTFDDGLVQLHALESGGPNIASVIYEFGPGSEGGGAVPVLRGARFTDSYWEWHRRLEKEGRIAHPAAACPQRVGLDVRRWTPAAGWATITAPVR